MSAEKSDLFLMGLLSVVDALLDRPMEQVLSSVPVAAEVREALTGGSNRFRDVYETLLAYEQADWNKLTTVAGTFPAIETHVPKLLSDGGRPCQRDVPLIWKRIL